MLTDIVYNVVTHLPTWQITRFYFVYLFWDCPIVDKSNFESKMFDSNNLLNSGSYKSLKSYGKRTHAYIHKYVRIKYVCMYANMLHCAIKPNYLDFLPCIFIILVHVKPKFNAYIICMFIFYQEKQSNKMLHRNILRYKSRRQTSFIAFIV